MKTLTPNQAAAYAFIASFIAENGHAPTLRQLGAHLKVAESTAHGHVSALVKAGRLKKVARKMGGLALVEREDAEDLRRKLDALIRAVDAVVQVHVSAQVDALAGAAEIARRAS